MCGEGNSVEFFMQLNLNSYQMEIDDHNNKDLYKLHGLYKDETSNRYVNGKKIKPNPYQENIK